MKNKVNRHLIVCRIRKCIIHYRKSFKVRIGGKDFHKKYTNSKSRNKVSVKDGPTPRFCPRKFT